jgi:hypothetical protein
MVLHGDSLKSSRKTRRRALSRAITAAAAVIREPINAISRIANSPFYRPFATPVTGQTNPAARVLHFPSPPSSAPTGQDEGPSITRILSYTSPSTSAAARSALPLLFPKPTR